MTQSPELAGGDGFTYEGDAAAYYLSALLAGAYAPGVSDRIVVGVSVQQRDFGEPLDDVIVDFSEAGSNANKARLSLQVKRSLTISDADTNYEFRDIIRDSWTTFKKTDFQLDKDRFGVAVGTISASKQRALNTLCELARESLTTSHFETRFSESGNASKELKSVKEDIVDLLGTTKGSACTPEEIHQFLAHFVLIQFDFLHEGATNSPEAINLIKNSLVAEESSKAPLVWSKMVQLARASAGKAGQFDRARLVRELSVIVKLRGADSLHQDLDKLTELAKSYANLIPDDVGGTRLNRDELISQLDTKLQRARVIQVTGLPGGGKSVLMRRSVQRAIDQGPTLFLKAEQLEGTSWLSFANHHGLSSVSIEALLVEIAASGTPVLFIDAIDRVDKERQGIILDLIRTIKESTLLDQWHFVVSLRDSGIEVLRNWLGEYLDDLVVETVNVSQLDDDEAEELAKEKPHLRPLLFGSSEVKSIVRRPFFAKVLNHSYQADPDNQSFIPQSEVDLIEHWWRLGGYNEQGQNALERQQVLLDLAGVRSRSLSQPIRLSDLASIQHIDSLKSDGVLQDARLGISINFAHDIFFEWAFFHVLGDKGDKWIDEIKACGEPPAVARVVELVSQWEYIKGESWSSSQALTVDPSLRSQWQRAWLVGPFGNSTFESSEEQFEVEVFANEFLLLRKVLVWFQAEKTSPNMNVLLAHLPLQERQRFADLLGWPSDFSSWRRLIAFILKRISKIPQRLFPEIVSIFEVWQNALSELDNPASKAMLKQCANWLKELDEVEYSENPNEKSAYWNEAPNLGDFRKSIIRLLLRSTKVQPSYSQEYLQRYMNAKHSRDGEFSEIMGFSPILAQVIPDSVVELSLSYLCQELPDDQVVREKKERQARMKWRKALLEKPESERTEKEQRALGFSAPFHISNDFSYHDWERLCIQDNYRDFYPMSPLREPFFSLFKHSPDYALDLLNGLCNHAVTAWKQLRNHSYEQSRTPIPLELTFPWGTQMFWGEDQWYLWFSSSRMPKVIECGLMALEQWAFLQLGSGRSAEDVIKQIVEGNECISILSISSLLAIHTHALSDVTFPLFTSQRLLHLDKSRMLNEMQLTTRLIGFKAPSDKVHIDAIKESFSRPVRQKDLSWLTQICVISGGEQSELTKAAILNFKNNLPFQYEEHRDESEAKKYLSAQADGFAELADIQNYKAYKTDNGSDNIVVVHESPSANTPKAVSRANEASKYIKIANLWAWASKFFEGQSLGEAFSMADALTISQDVDSEDLFSNSQNESTEESLGMCRGAVSAAAAVALNLKNDCSHNDLSWARDVLTRAIQLKEKPDAMWSPHSAIPWHQGIFVARGLGADLRDGAAEENAVSDLFSLIAHPLEVVSLAAIDEACKLWSIDPKLTWASLVLAFSLCKLPGRGRMGQSDPEYNPQPSIDTALENYQHGTGWTPLPLPPKAWIKIEPGDERYQRRSYSQYKQYDVIDESQYWAEPEEFWMSQKAAKVLDRTPHKKILQSEAKDEFLEFLEGVLEWTNQKNAPHWIKPGRRKQSAIDYLEWTHSLGARLGMVAGLPSLCDFQSKFLDPMLNLEGDNCWGILSSFSSAYVCSYVYDAKEMPDDAIKVLELIVDRLLKSSSFRRNAYRSGELTGFDQPKLVETMMFVSVEQADLAARYVNGDWSEIERILPIVDKFVRNAGWAASVMYHFLTLCERAKDNYPAEPFAGQILSIISDGLENLKGWHGTFIPARIAELIQHFSHRDTPMDQELAQKFLKILDMLVDMGDRRSAALQLSEVFREIRLT